MDVPKNLCDGDHKFFYWNGGAVSGVSCKNIFVADLLGSQYLFEILQTSLTVKNSKNVVKNGCSINVHDGERQFFLEMKEG